MGSPNTSMSGRPLQSVIKPDRQVTESADEASVLCASSLVFAPHTISTKAFMCRYIDLICSNDLSLTIRENGSNSTNQNERNWVHDQCLIHTLKYIKISDSSYLSDANNGSQKQFVTIFPVQNDSLLCLSMTHFTNVAYCSATLSYIPVSGAWSGVSMRLSSHRPI